MTSSFFKGVSRKGKGPKPWQATTWVCKMGRLKNATDPKAGKGGDYYLGMFASERLAAWGHDLTAHKLRVVKECKRAKKLNFPDFNLDLHPFYKEHGWRPLKDFLEWMREHLQEPTEAELAAMANRADAGGHEAGPALNPVAGMHGSTVLAPLCSQALASMAELSQQLIWPFHQAESMQGADSSTSPQHTFPPSSGEDTSLLVPLPGSGLPDPDVRHAHDEYASSPEVALGGYYLGGSFSL